METDFGPAEIGMMNIRQIDLLNVLLVDVVPVVEERYICRFIESLNTECLVCGGGRLVPSFRSGNALDELKRCETLHLIADCSRSPIDAIGNILALDSSFALTVPVDQLSENVLLSDRQLD